MSSFKLDTKRTLDLKIASASSLYMFTSLGVFSLFWQSPLIKISTSFKPSNLKHRGKLYLQFIILRSIETGNNNLFDRKKKRKIKMSLHDKDGQRIGFANGTKVFNKEGELLGYWNDTKVFSKEGGVVGFLNGTKVYSAQGTAVGFLNGTKIFAHSGENLGFINAAGASDPNMLAASRLLLFPVGSE